MAKLALDVALLITLAQIVVRQRSQRAPARGLGAWPFGITRREAGVLTGIGAAIGAFVSHIADGLLVPGALVGGLVAICSWAPTAYMERKTAERDQE